MFPGPLAVVVRIIRVSPKNEKRDVCWCADMDKPKTTVQGCAENHNEEERPISPIVSPVKVRR